MSEKVTELSWVAFAKSELNKEQRKLVDDAALVKALAAADRAREGDKPAAQRDALQGVVEQCNKQVVALAKRKKDLGDKLFDKMKDKLHGLLEAAEMQHKALAAQARKAAEEDDDEQDDSPALLTSKMVPLIRQLRKGQERMHALVCTAGKNTSVLIMRRPISPTRRKLLAEAVDAKGGAKYLVGECVFEEGALSFILNAQVGGLAKRLRAALLQQTDLRLKVKVRGEDGEESDGEDEGQEQEGVKAASGAPPSPQPPTAEQLSYVQRLGKLRERYDQALAEQHPESTKLRALMGFASEKADAQKDYAAASKALDMLDKLLGSVRAGSSPEAQSRTLDRLKQLVPRVKEAVASGLADADAIRLAVSEAGTLARQGEYAAADVLLDDVEQKLAAPRTSGGQAARQSEGRAAPVAAPGRTGRLVETRKFLVTRWQRIPGEIRADLNQLKDAIKRDMPGEDADSLIKAAQGYLDNFCGDMKDAIDDAINLSDTNYSGAIAVIHGLRDRASNEPLIRHLNANQMNVVVQVEAIVLKALAEVEEALAAP